MFRMMLCTTLSLVEKLASKIRYKHVSELHIIIVIEKLPHASMNHLCSWLAWQERTQCPAHLNFITVLREISITWETCTLEERQVHAISESPTCWSTARLSVEPTTDMCNQPHVSPCLSHSLPLWLMSPPDSIEAIR